MTAIKKADATQLQMQEAGEWVKIEEYINNYLQSHYAGKGSRVTINLVLICNAAGIRYLGERHRNRILREYQESGWQVDFHTDQRDGDWFNFS